MFVCLAFVDHNREVWLQINGMYENHFKSIMSKTFKIKRKHFCNQSQMLVDVFLCLNRKQLLWYLSFCFSVHCNLGFIWDCWHKKSSIESLQVPIRKILWCFHLKCDKLHPYYSVEGWNPWSRAQQQLSGSQTIFPISEILQKLNCWANIFAKDRCSFAHCSVWKDAMLHRKLIKG